MNKRTGKLFCFPVFHQLPEGGGAQTPFHLPLFFIFKMCQKTGLLLILDFKKAFDSIILIEGTCKIWIFFLPLFRTFLFFMDILVLSCLFGPFQVIWWNVREGGRMDGTQFYTLGFGAFHSFCIFL